ncbi:Cupredoxin [Mycotypha africana]|uniref:Cupredoxin n=1 Tax=Mycotypha africana TaxID=64632 RepID=UPI0023015222|nr:Cupredoxin [Mycotypha africana]KAI8970040.1 Cupredoxin [Mycotypha africana]
MKQSHIFLWALFFGSSTICQARRVELDWNLGYEIINPDGLHERRAITINNQWPPEPVKLTINDTLVIHVQNDLNEPTTLHAHGLLQNHGTNTHDGAAMVTQCPIPPHYNFTYEYPVTQAGTFWIHSHFKVQYMDGLRVPLIVTDPNDPYSYDEEEIITVSDWYHEDSYTNLEQYMNEENIEGVEPVPQSGLINDHINSTFHFKPGKTYRIRLINMSGLAVFKVAIDDHEMTVIEVDGVLTEPVETAMVYMAPGQRISVLLKTKDTTDVNYHLRASMAPVMFDYIPEDLDLTVVAPVYYDDSHSNFAPKDDSKPTRYDDGAIFPLKKAPLLSPVNRQINMTIAFMKHTDGLNHGLINDRPYLPPLVPTLHTVFTVEPKSLVNNTDIYGPQTQVSLLELNDIVEVVINNLDDSPHPFHLHDHMFQVVARGSDGVYDPNRHKAIYPENPTFRDTIGVPSNGFAVLRFRADNPGAWIFHCHVDWHVPAGLAAVFITAPQTVREKMTFPHELIELCKVGGQPAKGNAAGKQGLDLEGAPDGVRPIDELVNNSKRDWMITGLIATLIGVSTIVWHTWVDPGPVDEDSEREDERKPLMAEKRKDDQVSSL